MGVDKARRNQPVTAIDPQIGIIVAGIRSRANLSNTVIANKDVSAIDHLAFRIERENQSRRAAG